MSKEIKTGRTVTPSMFASLGRYDVNSTCCTGSSLDCSGARRIDGLTNYTAQVPSRLRCIARLVTRSSRRKPACAPSDDLLETWLASRRRCAPLVPTSLVQPSVSLNLVRWYNVDDHLTHDDRLRPPIAFYRVSSCASARDQR
jgi:hypothetical protein